jgi:hypothetical protein
MACNAHEEKDKQHSKNQRALGSFATERAPLKKSASNTAKRRIHPSSHHSPKMERASIHCPFPRAEN